MPITYTLHPVDQETVEYFADRRAGLKEPSRERAGYQSGKDNGFLQDEPVAERRSLTAECGVARVLRRPWTVPLYPNELHPVLKDHPDVGPTGEVRTIRLDKTSIHRGWPVWKKDAGREIICCTVDEWTVTIYGYIWADTVLENASRFEVGPVSGCYFVPVSELEPFAMDLDSFMAGRVLV